MQDRRAWCKRMGLLLGTAGIAGCSGNGHTGPTPSERTYTDQERAEQRRFRGIRGGSLIVDALFRVSAVDLYTEKGYVFARGVFGPKNGSHSSYGGRVEGDRLVMPRTLRYVRFPEGSKYNGQRSFPAFDGAPIVDVTVPVASRISDEALDTARRLRGNLRLKLRLHPETVLVGWDVEHFPDFQPGKRNQFGVLITGAPVYHAVGGDFQRAEIIEGVVVRKGWYIDPKTGQKIETDF